MRFFILGALALALTACGGGDDAAQQTLEAQHAAPWHVFGVNDVTYRERP